MNTPPLYFLHIDKTGGMSLSWVLRRAYPMHHSVVSAQYEDVSYIDSFHSYDYIDGHLAWLPDHLLQPGTLRCTVLRDPIARTISHMLYDQYSLSANLLANLDRLKPFITKEEEEALRKGDFLRVLQTETFRTRYENRQCKSLSRIFFDTSNRDDNLAIMKWTPPANESDFIVAQQHLQAIDFVGLTERLDDTAHMIGAAIGLSVEKVPRKNVTLRTNDSSTSISAFEPSQQREILQIIEDLNRYDIELYRMAQERFKAQWEAYAHLPPVQMTNRVRFHSATWSAYGLLQRVYNHIFKNSARGRLRLLHRIRWLMSARKTPRALGHIRR
jgi:hypothetical protein